MCQGGLIHFCINKEKIVWHQFKTQNIEILREIRFNAHAIFHFFIIQEKQSPFSPASTIVCITRPPSYNSPSPVRVCASVFYQLKDSNREEIRKMCST